jgi:hypothetical protein
VKISVSKESQWEPEIFAKAPMELLLCEELHPNAKLLWVVLANQSRFGPLDKSVLDRMIGIHRSTRIRCIRELRDIGLIKGTDDHIVLPNPVPILRKIIESTNKARAQAQEMLLGYTNDNEVELPKKTKQEKVNYLEIAKNAWNSYRPANYSRVNVMSSELIKALDSHISALKLKPHSYEEFFAVIKVGIEHSPFWSKDNSSKNLQSIIGIGSPQPKKYQNVYMLYNEGLNHEKGEALDETDRQDQVVISSEFRHLIDDYDELQFMYYELSKNDPANINLLDDRIQQTEQSLRDAGLDPAKFRMKYQLSTWPTSVPEPENSRERFWRYDDEK